ncbi:hypothetical protein SELMODRAFT_407055 [Selaginella moellendorffii]|uniref:Uncharacterized protein n=1 Tax=Selaginella moellendorffii TaxID=88036 RepID=D8R3S4_SELML|nr:hypothetical protein SELMODRAFT_407055 [Selaginella moellendorffii]
MYSLDFGWGKPATVRHATKLWNGFCFYDPSPRGGKAIEVTVFLPPETMAKFKHNIPAPLGVPVLLCLSLRVRAWIFDGVKMKMDDFQVKITEVHLLSPANPTERCQLPFTTFALMQKRDSMPYLQRVAFYESTGKDADLQQGSYQTLPQMGGFPQTRMAAIQEQLDVVLVVKN